MRLALALTLALTTPAVAQDMSTDERAAFRAEVRAYLLDNPEVIMEAIQVLQGREQAQAAVADQQLITNNADALFNDPTSFVGGNPDGDITIVEFLDYRCGYCKRAHPEVAELIARDGNIRLIVKEFPILGEASTLASQYALAVKLTAGDDAYKIVNDTLMAMRGDVNPATLARVTKELGLDDEAIRAAMDSDDVAQILQDNRRLGQAMQINGTPSFVIETELLRGYLPLDQMQQVVAQARG
jgi:protein-disulfide isomerase